MNSQLLRFQVVKLGNLLLVAKTVALRCARPILVMMRSCLCAPVSLHDISIRMSTICNFLLREAQQLSCEGQAPLILGAHSCFLH
eukprot:358430-Amphidinium_carterae.1